MDADLFYALHIAVAIVAYCCQAILVLWGYSLYARRKILAKHLAELMGNER